MYTEVLNAIVGEGPLILDATTDVETDVVGARLELELEDEVTDADAVSDFPDSVVLGSPLPFSLVLPPVSDGLLEADVEASATVIDGVVGPSRL